jgi:hypothetical protein
MLISLLSAAPAHARPSFQLEQTSARAGDAVRFTISNVNGWGVAYHLELAGADLQNGRGANAIAGTFRMPDLGEGARYVALDAYLWWANTSRRVQTTVHYLGPRPPDPPAPAPPPTLTKPDVVSQPAPGPSSSPSSSAPAAKGPPSSHARPKAERRRGHARTRRAAGKKRSTASKDKGSRRAHRARDRHRRKAAAKHRRSKRSMRGAGPFLNGFQGPGGSNAADADDSSGQKPSPRPTVLTASRDSGIGASTVVPVALTLAALGLVGSAVMRRRRLASRGDRSRP